MSIKQVDTALGRYYGNFNINDYFDENGIGIFQRWCDENGYDDEGVNTELSEDDPNDCVLCEFDEDNFPLKQLLDKSVTKSEQIYEVLKNCLKDLDAYTLSHDSYFPEMDKNFFNVSEEETEETIRLYSNQCASIFDAGMINDKTIIEILTIGQKHKVQYLQHLADMFCRDRINYHHQTMEIKCRALDIFQWTGKDSKHFELLRKIAPKKVDLVKSSISSYFKRVCPKLLLSETWRIRDSCEESTKYVTSCILWIHKLATSRKECCPFQMDMVVGYPMARWDQIIDPNDMRRDIKELYEEKEKYDDGSNDFDEKQKYRDKSVIYFDCMGDVKSRTSNAALNRVITTIEAFDDDATDRSARIFDTIFKKFEQQTRGKNFPRNRRWVTFLDRRADEDEIIMYDPPDHCKFIPRDYVPLWFLSASRSCLIPNETYDGDEHDAANAVHLTVVAEQMKIDGGQGAEYQYKLAKLVSKIPVKGGMDFEMIVKISLERYAKIWVHRQDEPIKYRLMKGPVPTYFEMRNEDTLSRKYRSLQERLQNVNVTSEHHCKGGMLIISFHVLASDQIKAYFYYSGQIARFMPQDIMHIFPKYFCQTWQHGENRKWWHSGKAKEYYEIIKDKLPDVKFEAFCKQFKAHYQPRPRDSKEEQEERERQKNMLLFG